MIRAAAIRSSRRMPDFAGVALVDILANGVAMLIIVIVVTIAARMEREERYAEQADEVATVMSHKFSTSLVLNSLAASPPARLHDYETSPLDRVLDPRPAPHPGAAPGLRARVLLGDDLDPPGPAPGARRARRLARGIQRGKEGAPAGRRLRHPPVLPDDVHPARARASGSFTGTSSPRCARSPRRHAVLRAWLRRTARAVEP